MSKPVVKRSTGSNLKRLLTLMFKEYKIQLVFVLVMILLSAYANVKGSLFLQVVIDQYITPLIGQTHPNFSGLLQAILQMALIYLVGVIASLTYNFMMVKISEGTQKKIRDQMFTHLESLPIRYFDANSDGDIMSHFTNDTDTLRQMISQSIPNLMMALVTFVSVFIAMFTISLPLTGFVLISVFLMMNVIRFISKKSGRFFGAQQKDLGQVNGYIEEMMHGQKVVKIFNHEKKVMEEFDTLNDQLQESATKANINANTLMPIMMNLLNVQYVLVAIIGGLFAINGISGLTVGMIASFLQLSRSLNGPISQISQQINFVIMALAGAGRIFNLLDEKSEQDDGYVTLVNAKKVDDQLVETKERTGLWAWKHPHEDGSITYTELTGDVVFEDVDFGYVDNNIVLHDINLYAKPGEKVAFVGATGAGKTTITNLINRFYDIQDGKIRYDGINIKKIKKDSLRRSLGIVLQDTHLFTGTIRENIRFGKLDASDEDVLAAAKLANADGFINHLPDKYDTVITGDGEGLSQGQRQLLAIARAAIADPPVMILDEATSSIDTRTEGIVQSGMDRLMHGRTVFVIAHRLSTIQNADVIMVLDHGRIIERGSHEALLAEKGMYYQLYTGKVELD
ncbi:MULTISPECIES: ABC transporter ATP-binding protein [Enterococcus]|uniref:ABC transporter ATP-binding protein n=2 Tax=Enterococcus TaxID=1350 RepID=UPI0021D42E44|nr:ABC transporter ATP-binding protein [Enterococcus dispar]MCU7358287.1 ABC transporter ATP-binding protein/permease [Enterococcus dispar]MDT2706447.1 ABC transporter ATP-binding protein [Enterococcus dispar]WCG33349.1 ABC transporter ATP-binding protein [Enterococcus dispar]